MLPTREAPADILVVIVHNKTRRCKSFPISLSLRLVPGDKIWQICDSSGYMRTLPKLDETAAVAEEFERPKKYSCNKQKCPLFP